PSSSPFASTNRDHVGSVDLSSCWKVKPATDGSVAANLSWLLVRWVPLGAGGDQRAKELLDAGVDVVADAADDLDRLAGRVLELPVLIALARVDRAGIPTAHGDDHIRGPD